MAAGQRVHLSEHQLFRLAEGEVHADWLRHAESCPTCAEQLRSLEQCLALLHQFRARPDEMTEKTPQCLSDADVVALVMGTKASEDAERQLAHAARCGYCGASLQAALDTGERKRRNVTDIAKAKNSRNAGRMRLTWIGIAAAALLSMAPIAYRLRSPDPASLLAEAYREARPFASRIPGAVHAPIAQVRAGTISLDRPNLTRAASLIQSRQSDSDYPLWKGSYELLTLNLDQAIDSLRRAHTSARQDSNAVILLAAALYQRGIGANRREDLLEALDLLTPAVHRREASPEILFNSALVLEALHMRMEAAAAWREAERQSDSQGWAAEARAHLDQLEQQLRSRKVLIDRIANDPLQALSNSPEVDPEFLLGAAWTDWYPNLEAAREKRTALGRLAHLLIEKHRDPMLGDLLSGGYVANAAAKLGGAIRLNRTGVAEQAAALSAEVVQHPGLAQGNRPLWLRARTERVYALHLQYRNAACLEEAAALDRELASTHYLWLQAQVRLELANCLSFRNDYAAAIVAAEQARAIAAKAHYDELELRAIGLASGFRNLAGDLSGTLSEDPEALARYWAKPFAPNRGAQFFHNAVRASEALGFSHAALASAMARLDVMEGVGAPAIQARGRAQLALLAVRLGDRELARKQLEQARTDFARITESAAAMRTDAEIDLLQAQMLMNERSEFEPALARLEEVVKNPPTADAELRAREMAARIALTVQRSGQALQFADEGIRLHQNRIRNLTGWSLYQARSSHYGLYRAKAIHELEQRHDAQAALRAWLSSRATMIGDEELREIVRRLGPRTLVVFAELGGSVQRFALRREGLSTSRISASELELAQAGEELRRLAANPASPLDAVDAKCRNLRSLLLEGLPGTGSLVIMSDPALAGIPWRLIAGGDFAVHRTACCREAAPLELTSGIILAPNVREPFASLYPPLPDAQQEVSALLSAGIHARAIRGVQAVRESVKAEGDLFHFAGHATAAGLVMAASSGFALFDPISASRQDWSQCRLVALSACSTALSATRSNAGSQTLVDGFLAGGARNVLASLWNVDTLATRALMTEFYAGLRTQMVPAEALSRAVQSIKLKPGWQHPYYWAAFQLYH